MGRSEDSIRNKRKRMGIEMPQQKILIIDIETAPITAFTW
jgi:hypothetical protein